VPKPTISLRIDLPNGSRLGPGKVALLEAVRQHHSISAAARHHGMSYRRAWLLIDDMNRAFSEVVVETYPGRSQAAGAAVTPFGEALIELYKAAEAKSEHAISGALEEIVSLLNTGYENQRESGSAKNPRRQQKTEPKGGSSL